MLPMVRGDAGDVGDDNDDGACAALEDADAAPPPALRLRMWSSGAIFIFFITKVQLKYDARQWIVLYWS